MKYRLFLFGLVVVALVTVAYSFRGARDAKKSVAGTDHSPLPTATAPALRPTAGSTPLASAAGQNTASLATVSPAEPSAWLIPARPGAVKAPTKSEEPIEGAPESLPLAANFLDQILDGGEKTASFPLPDGSRAIGAVEMLRRDAQGVSLVQGRLSAPEPGFYYFERPATPGVAGALVGVVRFDNSSVAYRAEPVGPNGSPALVARRLDQVLCVGLPPVQTAAAAASVPQNAPQTHPTDIAIPDYQNNIIPLQSLPGAAAVVYLDFDGEKGPFPGWGNFDAAPSGATNAEIKEVWQRVAEDFQAFNINVTTDRRIFDNATPTSRQHVIVTPTKNAAPTAGGVAYYGSFNGGGNSVCWAFYWTGKSAAEVISHEIGHTLNLSHDGRKLADGSNEEYYGGQGDGDTGWAPIMGAGYYKNLTQWSKGEYANPTNTEDDLTILTNNNNSVDYRVDDYGDSFETAGYLEVQPNNSVSNEGILETREDVDAFRFTSSGGAVSLTVSPVSAGPNLDIQAEIYNSSNVRVAVSNPADQINATVAANLPAGDYTLRVSGVGKGDPLTTGYSDYGTLGAYLVTGTAVGGVKPDRFTIPENSANGTAVGSVTTRKAHGENALVYEITSGNLDGAFALDPATGALTVANRNALNYEALSSQWDDPATIPLIVSITDATDSSLNETVRVVVTVSNVNEAPTITGGSATMFSHAKLGTEIFTVVGADVDRFDFPRFSIVSGNTAGLFALDPSSGRITVAADIDVTTTTSYPLTVRATDRGTPALTATTMVTVTVQPAPAGYVTGSIVQTSFDGISGNSLSALTGSSKYPNSPDALRYLTSFDADSRARDDYGSTIRGYLIPPTTGNYTFWIASDDNSELRISSSAATNSTTLRASVPGHTDPYQYEKYGSQKSTEVPLVAGQPYYVEVRHKQGVGGDHVTVAWQGPGIARQIIPGRYLAPFYQNYAPKMSAQTFSVRRGAYTGATVGTVAVTDVDPEDGPKSFTAIGGTGSAFFGVDASGRIFVKDAAALAAAPSNAYTLSLRVNDSGSPTMVATAAMTINLVAADLVNVTGIVQQIWRDISNNTVASLTSDPRYPNSPTTSRTLTEFDTGTGNGEYYGSRIRAYVIPPTTGTYRFYLASDDAGQLWFSRSTPAAATQIASVTGWVDRNQWTAQSTQTSLSQSLVAGQKYYIEVRHKQGYGGDFVQVAWTGPGISTPTVIPGSALQPFDINAAPTWNGGAYAFTVAVDSASGSPVGAVSATDPEGGVLTYAIISGNANGAFAINSATGAITVADGAVLAAGQFTLSVGVQDNGGDYPQKSVLTNVSITVTTTLAQWRQAKFGADAGDDSIAGPAADPDQDGMSNLLEYALGTEPLTWEPPAYTVDLETIGSARYLRLTTPRNPAAVEATLKVEVAGNLTGWTSAGTTIEANTATQLRVRDQVNVSSANARFIRLSVTGP